MSMYCIKVSKTQQLRQKWIEEEEEIEGPMLKEP
jgi:hypothetical protein